MHWLNALHVLHRFAEVVTGGAPGADTWALVWAEQRRIDRVVFHANWGRYGKAAGPRRNEKMARYLHYASATRCCIAFPGGRGTQNMIETAQRYDITVITQPPVEG